MSSLVFKNLNISLTFFLVFTHMLLKKPDIKIVCELCEFTCGLNLIDSK